MQKNESAPERETRKRVTVRLLREEERPADEMTLA